MEAEISRPEYENQLAAYQNMRTQVKGLIDNTQAQKKDLDEKLANGKKVLSDNGFTDRASVDAMSASAEKLYSEYASLKTECNKKSRKILSALTAVLGSAGLGAAAYSDISTSPPIFRSAALLQRRLCSSLSSLWSSARKIKSITGYSTIPPQSSVPCLRDIWAIPPYPRMR